MASSIWHISYFDLTLRILLAVICGGGIGIEREWSNHAAGFRTHILVCVGSASIMLLSIYGFGEFVTETNVRIDPARLAAQVISGIGFIGAGAIMRSGLSIKGLTTAASIWVVAAIGLCVGAGFLYCAFLVTAVVFICLFMLNKFEKHLMRNRRDYEVIIKFVDRPGNLGLITTKFSENGIRLNRIQMSAEQKITVHGSEQTVLEAKFSLKTTDAARLVSCLEYIPASVAVVGIDAEGLDKFPLANVSSAK